MVKFLYCPQCGAIDIQKLPEGTDYCPKCHFKGTAREGAMDELNAFRKQINKTASSAPLQQQTAQTSQAASKPKRIANDDYEVW